MQDTNAKIARCKPASRTFSTFGRSAFQRRLDPNLLVFRTKKGTVGCKPTHQAETSPALRETRDCTSRAPRIPARSGNFARSNERPGEGAARTVGAYRTVTDDWHLHSRDQFRRTEVCRRTGEQADPMRVDFARKLHAYAPIRKGLLVESNKPL